METLSFLATIGFCAAVLFWYITNLNIRSAGERGLLGLVQDRLEQVQQTVRGYRQKSRIRSTAEKTAEAFSNRNAAEKQKPVLQSGRVSEDRHTVRKIALKSPEGTTINPDIRPATERPSRYAQRRTRTLNAKHQPEPTKQDNTDAEPQPVAPKFRYKKR